MILDRIVATKRKEVEQLKKAFKLPLDQKSLPKIRDFSAAISKPGIRLIAEVKAASPSAGRIVKDYDPVSIARTYEKGGASAISVLTDREYFSGSLDHMVNVKKAVGLPVLRKDFIIDQSQIYESRISGADAVLLITRILTQGDLEGFIKITSDLGMTPLVEVHSVEETRSALDAGAEVIGINNRDLDTLDIDIKTTLKIMKALPQLKNKVLISESGISTRAEVDLLSQAGVNAVLVGEALLKGHDIPGNLKDLLC